MLTAVLATGESVRLSVCPSVTRWYCVKTNEATIMQFSLSGSAKHSSFWRGEDSPEIRRGSPVARELKVRPWNVAI